MVDDLSQLPVQDDLPIMVLPIDSLESKELLQLMQDYKKECQTRKARAIKYGTDYKEVTPQDFLPWSKAKRLRENPEKGFITGIDMMDTDEVARREARKARFGNLNESGSDKNEDQNDVTEKNDDGQASEKAGSENDGSKKGDLPVEQAWDKETLLRPLRSDPPSHLWKDASPETIEAPNPFAMERPNPATWVPEKLHLSSIDWAAFKQIRNKDIMSYFSVYGPSYVEWLGDVSCNVCFEDKHTASRALWNLSNEIPTPIPETILNGISEDSRDSMPDLGKMTWRFGKQAIRKVSNDRYGRRGTTARVLMRVATSEDILQERPNSWPAPPGGFSNTKVLGPDSDYAPKKQHQQLQQQQDRRGSNKSKNKRQRRDTGSANDRPKEKETAENLMDRGLSSGRAGFSVEEMEKERARKRVKVDEAT